MQTKYYSNLLLPFFLLLILDVACTTKKEADEKGEALEALQFLSAMNSFPNKDVPPEAYGRGYEYFKQEYKNTGSKIANTLLPWTTMGPTNNGGRTISIAIDPTDTSIIWLGSASGGLWKTTVGGVGSNAWQYIETGFPVLGVSSIAINPQNHNEILIGTGETYSYGTAQNGIIIRTTRGSHGIGILKTINGGFTWTSSLNWLYQQQRGVWKILYNNQNSSTILAATTDGIYKSFNSGNTWIQTDTTKMVMDMVMDPSDTNIIYAGTGNLGSLGGGFYRSTNAGNSWTRITAGLPAFNTGRISITVNSSNPNNVYAHIADDANSQGLYSSTNKGLSWSLLNSTDMASYQGWYSKGMHIDPTDSNTIFVCGVYLWQSTDGGANFNQLTLYDPLDLQNEPWPDMHDIVANPLDPQKLYLLTDAGLYRSNNTGQSWQSCLDGYVVAQFYMGSVSASNSNIALAGAQNHGTQRYNGSSSWDWVLGGDGTCNAIDNTNDLLQYASYQYLSVQGSSDQGISFQFPVLSGNGAFVSPFEIAPSNQNVMYAGSDALYSSSNQGQTWTNYGPYGNDKILSIGISSTNPQKVYFASAPSASDPMKLFLSSTGGLNVTDISAGLPNRYPRDIAVNSSNDNEAWVVFSGFGSGHVFHTLNAGQTWTDISSTLPDVPFHSVLHYSNTSAVLFVGSDLGVFYSTNNGVSWLHAGSGVPEALMVFDIEYSPSDQSIVAFTHGRGAYKTPIAPFLTAVSSIVNSANNIAVNYSQLQQKFILSTKKASSGSLKIFDTRGAVVMNSTITIDTEYYIDAQNWKSGVYIIQFQNAGSSVIKRIVKL